MNAVAQPIPVKTSPLVRRINIYLALALVAFLLGFVPMWLQSRESASNLAMAL